MSYPKVIAILDAELGRLRAARELLTSESKGRRESLKLTEVLVEDASSSAALRPSPIEAQPKPEPKRIAARRQRERRSVPRKAKGADVVTLRGPVPAAPVYVSAEKVRSVLQQKDERETPAQKPELLTAEMLSNRWLRPTAH